MAGTTRGQTRKGHKTPRAMGVCQRLFWPLFLECVMTSYWLHVDRQAQEGDLRRLQIITSDELSLLEDLRGPFDKLEDALKIAKSLIESIVDKVLERLRTEKPRSFATFPTSSQAPEK